METLTCNRPERPKAYRAGVAFALLLLLSAMGAAGCSGIVITPGEDEMTTTAQVPFAGYALSPGDTLLLQAGNHDGVWVTQKTITASTRPTYAGTRIGYYWETTFDPRTLSYAAFSYRLDSDSSLHRYSVYLRVQLAAHPEVPPAEIHGISAQNPSTPSGSSIEDLWASFKSTNPYSTMRLRIPCPANTSSCPQ